MTQELRTAFPDVKFSGDVEGKSLYTVLNASFPKTEKSDMLLFNLDMAGICVSGGSACSSGASSVSHVIKAIHNGQSESLTPMRFSFCKHNTKEEIDIAVSKLKELL